MDRSELGRLIKEARLAKKMTQSEVVGDFITRNMLSQIESGTAIPSIKTLEYLSDKLDISIQMLSKTQQQSLEQQAKASEAPEFGLLKEVKRLFASGEYEKAAEQIKPHLLPAFPFYDEFCALYTRSQLALAETCRPADPMLAVSHAKEAVVYADKGVYAASECRERAGALLRELSASLQ